MFYQNSDLTYQFNITDITTGKTLTADDVETVEFCFNNVQKYYPSADCTYNDGFFVRLSQDDTARLVGKVAFQIRVKLSSTGEVVPSNVEIYDSMRALSGAIL